MKSIFLLSLIFLMTACSTSADYTRTLQSWHGQSSQSLTQQWGAADEVVTHANGSKILIYKTLAYAETPAPVPPTVGVNVSKSGTPVMVVPTMEASLNQVQPTLSCITRVEVDPRGMITQLTSSGNGCHLQAKQGQ